MDRRLLLAAGLAVPWMRVAHGQAAFPSRPVRLVVPFAAGGSTDLVARLVAEGMSAALGQNVVVDNHGGAGGSIGAALVAEAAPDGYTILMGTVATHAINAAVFRNLPYDPVTSFAPISLLALVPNVLVVTPGLPVTSVAELIALLKAEPGVYSYASAGNGTPSHLSAELLKSMAGVDMVHVPYKGAGPALVDVIAGHVPIFFDNLPPSLEQIRAGKVRGLAVTTAERSPAIPELPTVAETLPGYETYSWNALFGPAGTPPEIVARLNAAAVAALRQPAIRRRLDELSTTPVGSTPEALAAHVATEIVKWAPVVEAAGARVN